MQKDPIMFRIAPIFLFVAITAVAACDEIEGDRDRAAVGAAIGCAAGYTLVNGRCVEGAIIGGAAGALSN